VTTCFIYKHLSLIEEYVGEDGLEDDDDADEVQEPQLPLVQVVPSDENDLERENRGMQLSFKEVRSTNVSVGDTSCFSGVAKTPFIIVFFFSLTMANYVSK